MSLKDSNSIKMCGKDEIKELASLIEKSSLNVQALLSGLLDEMKSKKNVEFEKDVKYIHGLLGTPLELIRTYLISADGKRDVAVDMILNNTLVEQVKKDSLKENLDAQISTLEDELIRLESKISRSSKVFGSGTSFSSDSVEREQSLIERQLIEAKESKNVQFFCQGEKKALKGSSIQRWNIIPRNMFDLEAESIHFRIAESQFHRFLSTYGNSGQYRLDVVEYIVNPTLVKKFDGAKNKLAKRHGMMPESMKPVLLFHGTSETNMENILKTNFLISKVGSTTDMGWYGKGVYFSEFPGTSISYSGGNPWLLLCLVFVGKTFKMTEVRTGCELTQGFDSHISGDGSEVIIFDTDCILPCYKIKWVQGTQQPNANTYSQDQEY